MDFKSSMMIGGRQADADAGLIATRASSSTHASNSHTCIESHLRDLGNGSSEAGGGEVPHILPPDQDLYRVWDEGCGVQGVGCGMWGVGREV